MERTRAPTPSSCTHLRTDSNSGEPMAAYSPPTQGMMSCPTFSRIVSEARVLSTHRWSAAESGVVAPGLAGPSRRRADASTPGTMVGCTSDDAGAQANTNATTPILKFTGMIAYRRNVRETCQLRRRRVQHSREAHFYSEREKLLCIRPNKNTPGLRGVSCSNSLDGEAGSPYLLAVLSRHVRLVDPQVVVGATVISPRAVIV